MDSKASALSASSLSDTAQAQTGAIAGLIVTVIILLLTHRTWPLRCRRLDMVFAASHWITDSHAVRMLDTRLGAAYTLSLPLIVAVISIYVFGQDNTVTTTALVPAFTLEEIKEDANTTDSSFKWIDVNIVAASASPSVVQR